MLIASTHNNLPFFFADLKNSFHTFCLKQIPPSNYFELQAGLICGKSINDPQILEPLLRSSLYHIAVVSGAHLVIIIELFQLVQKKFFTSIKTKKIFNLILFLTLIIYVFICNFQAPVVRGLWGVFLILLNQRLRLSWHPIQILLLTVLMSLLTDPSWGGSRSLLLSATCSLILLSFENANKKQVAIYFLSLPLFLGWGNLHPLGIVTNLLMAPIIMFVLLPLALAGCISDWGQDLFNLSVGLLFKMLKNLLDPVSFTKTHPFFSSQALWIYFWLMSFLFYLKSKRKRV